MKPERIQLDTRLVRYQGGLGDVVTVALRQTPRIVRFNLDDERVRTLPAADAGDLLEQRRHYVELSADDDLFARRYGVDAVPDDVERDSDGRIVHSANTMAAVIVALAGKRRSSVEDPPAEPPAEPPTEKLSARKRAPRRKKVAS